MQGGWLSHCKVVYWLVSKKQVEIGFCCVTGPQNVTGCLVSQMDESLVQIDGGEGEGECICANPKEMSQVSLQVLRKMAKRIVPRFPCGSSYHQTFRKFGPSILAGVFSNHLLATGLQLSETHFGRLQVSKTVGDISASLSDVRSCIVPSRVTFDFCFDGEEKTWLKEM